MGKIKIPLQVKFFVGILLAEKTLWEEVKELLTDLLGKIQMESPFLDFTFTDYYREEMGKNIKRKLVLFEGLKDPALLSTIKIQTNMLEETFANRDGFSRPVNLDPGYVETSKVILASTKNFFHRIYIGSGIFAEVTLHWRGKKWNFFEWTYPDYRTTEYLEFFSKARDTYLKELRGE